MSAIVGYHAPHEQFPPSELLAHVRAAEAAGFRAFMCSDHLAPWSLRQGESGHAWSWLGAALATTGIPGGLVTSPGWRYHPAVVAQAAATLAEMFPGRFSMAVGSGEAINEHVTGERWPGKDERNARLAESVDVVRRLLAGETVTHMGRVRVDRARVYSLPPTPPRIVGAAVSEETAEWVGSWADALITISQSKEKLAPVVDAFRRGGGHGKPMLLQVQLAYADDDDEALRIAHDQWRMSALPGDVLWTLETPEQFDAATEHVRPEDVSGPVNVSADLERHVRWVREYAEMGFDEIYLHHVGRDQRAYIDAFGRHVLPPLEDEGVLAASARR